MSRPGQAPGLARRSAEALVRLQPYLHPRLYTLAVGAAWPLLREPDGYLPVRYGDLELRVDLREDAERRIYLHRYDPELTGFLEATLRPGDLVVDVGANVGAITAVAANAVGREGHVAAVEPNPRLASRLARMEERNPMGNVTVHPCAVGDRASTLPLHVSRSHPYATLDPAYLPAYPVDEVVDVPVRTLDDIVDGLPHRGLPRVVKIDAQGFENRIVAGAGRTLASRPPDFLVLEVVGEGFANTRARLASHGYEMRVSGPGGALARAPDGVPPASTNVVFVRAGAR